MAQSTTTSSLTPETTTLASKNVTKIDHSELLKQLDDATIKKRFDLETIKNLDIFKQNPRLFIRLKLCIEQNNYYEAHQTYKTLHFRCMNNNQNEDSLELIYNGICYFMENNQAHCGMDLAKTFVETLKKTSRKFLSKILIEKISTIYELLKSCPEERTDFAVNILKWSSAFNNTLANIRNKNVAFGHPDIHREFAIILWKEKNYAQSRYHFIHSFDGELCAHMLIEFHINCGFPSEIDLFITQTVLQYLCLKNKETAKIVFKHYIEVHPLIKQTEPPFNLPLMNFIWFLLLSIDEGRTEVFKKLRDIYKPSISIDLSFNDFLDKIGQIYFNIKTKSNDQQNPLNNLLRMFVSNDNDNTDNNEAESLESNYDSDSIQNMDDDDLLD